MGRNSGTPNPRSGHRTDRTLAWATADGELIPVNEMSDMHLINCINLQIRRIMQAKLATGHTSLSALTLQYLQDEARDRKIGHLYQSVPSPSSFELSSLADISAELGSKESSS